MAVVVKYDEIEETDDERQAAIPLLQSQSHIQSEGSTEGDVRSQQDVHDRENAATTTCTAGPARNAGDRGNEVYSKSRMTVRLLAWAMIILMFLLVFSTLVASKVALTTMLARLRSMSQFGNSTELEGTGDLAADMKTAVRLYWQLLLIVAIPNIITLVRAVFNGLIGGKSSSQPRPVCSAIIGVSHVSVQKLTCFHFLQCTVIIVTFTFYRAAF